jgi:hypothetical protein
MAQPEIAETAQRADHQPSGASLPQPRTRYSEPEPQNSLVNEMDVRVSLWVKTTVG